MEKSLLMLLKREDELVRRVKFHKDTYEELCSVAVNLANEYKEKQEETEKVLLSCRKEISQYLDFLEVLRED